MGCLDARMMCVEIERLGGMSEWMGVDIGYWSLGMGEALHSVVLGGVVCFVVERFDHSI